MQFRFSRRAEADLEEIAAYIARDNPARAVSFIRELRQHCQHLLTFPEAAPLRPELGVGVRLIQIHARKMRAHDIDRPNCVRSCDKRSTTVGLVDFRRRGSCGDAKARAN